MESLILKCFNFFNRGSRGRLDRGHGQENYRGHEDGSGARPASQRSAGGHCDRMEGRRRLHQHNAYHFRATLW